MALEPVWLQSAAVRSWQDAALRAERSYLLNKPPYGGFFLQEIMPGIYEKEKQS